MRMGAADADRTLFVGNLDPRATEELLFELFLQAGPALNVKIPKDKDGNNKLFAFVNFKHEESVPYGMNLLNGIKLFGRPLKIQFRSGSSHTSQDTSSAASSPLGSAGFPGNGPSANGNRYSPDARHDLSPPGYQRSYPSPDSLQRQAMMNNFYRQGSFQGPASDMMPPPSSSSSSSNYPPYYSPYNQSSSHSTPVRYDSSHSVPTRHDSSHSHRKMRSQSSHPYQNDGHHGGKDAYYRGGHEDRGHQRTECRWRPSRY